MKHPITRYALVALLALPFAASAQNAAPKSDAPAARNGMTMNCPMMTNMSAMQRDMGGVMSEMLAMMKDTKDPALKERMQKMHDRMSAMVVSMQKMGSMGMMGGQQPGNTAPVKPDATPPAAPVSPEDHAEHHPAP